MNTNTNLVCEHHELSLSVAGLSGSLLSNLSSWSFMNNPNFMNIMLGISGWQFMNVLFVVQKHSWTVHEHM